MNPRDVTPRQSVMLGTKLSGLVLTASAALTAVVVIWLVQGWRLRCAIEVL